MRIGGELFSLRPRPPGFGEKSLASRIELSDEGTSEIGFAARILNVS